MSAVCKNGSLRHSAVLKVILFWLIKTQCSSEGYTVLMTGQGWAGLGRAGQGRAGQGRAGLAWAGQGKAGLGRAGQGWPGQGRANPLI